VSSDTPTLQLTFLRPDTGDRFTVSLRLDTFRPLVGELRLARPDLAAAIEDLTLETITLRDGDTAALAVAARVLLESQLVEDPALERLAEL
jgi:hypothetical protein